MIFISVIGLSRKPYDVFCPFHLWLCQKGRILILTVPKLSIKERILDLNGHIRRLKKFQAYYVSKFFRRLVKGRQVDVKSAVCHQGTVEKKMRRPRKKGENCFHHQPWYNTVAALLKNHPENTKTI